MIGVTSIDDQAGSLLLEDGTYRLFRNFGNKLPINAGLTFQNNRRPHLHRGESLKSHTANLITRVTYGEAEVELQKDDGALASTISVVT
jgi:hypothetical protein